MEAGCDPEQQRDNKGRTPLVYFITADKSYVGDENDYWDESPFNLDDCQKMVVEDDIHEIDHESDKHSSCPLATRGR